MTRMIFINLPVTNLPRSQSFYEALGFTLNPMFSDDTAVCMVLSEAIHVMLLTHPKWRQFTQRPIPDPGSSETMLALSCDNPDAVHAMAEAAARSGGSADPNPPQDYGWMVSRSLLDPDGHLWEPMWMDPAAAPPAN